MAGRDIRRALIVALGGLLALVVAVLSLGVRQEVWPASAVPILGLLVGASALALLVRSGSRVHYPLPKTRPRAILIAVGTAVSLSGFAGVQDGFPAYDSFELWDGCVAAAGLGLALSSIWTQRTWWATPACLALAGWCTAYALATSIDVLLADDNTPTGSAYGQSGWATWALLTVALSGLTAIIAATRSDSPTSTHARAG